MLSLCCPPIWDLGQLHAKQHALMRLLFSLLLRCSFLVSAHPPHFASRLVGIQASFHPTTNTPLLLSSNPGTVQTLNTLMVDEPARRAHACLLCAAEHMIHSVQLTYELHCIFRLQDNARRHATALCVFCFINADLGSNLAMTCSHTAWGINGWSIPVGKC